jgi:hypothetical protein
MSLVQEAKILSWTRGLGQDLVRANHAVTLVLQVVAVPDISLGRGK